MPTVDRDKKRAEIRANVGDDGVEAYDILSHINDARLHGLEWEWMQTFLTEIKAGGTPYEAAYVASSEWLK